MVEQLFSIANYANKKMFWNELLDWTEVEDIEKLSTSWEKYKEKNGWISLAHKSNPSLLTYVKNFVILVSTFKKNKKGDNSMSEIIKPNVGEYYVKKYNVWTSSILFSTKDKNDAISFAISQSKKYSDEILVYKCNTFMDDEIWSSKK